MNGETREVVRSSNYLGGATEGQGWLQKNVKIRLGEALKNIGAMNKMRNVRNLSLGVYKGLYGQVEE